MRASAALAAGGVAIEAQGGAGGPGGGANLKPVGAHRHLGAEAGMARGSHPEGPGRGFGMEEVLEHAALHQAEPAGGGAFAIEAGGADVAGVKAVVGD